MKTEQPEEYYQEKETISKEYKEKDRKIFRNCVIGFTVASILSLSSVVVKDIKSKNLKKNYPIYQEYIDNQNSLRYLKNELNQQSERFPEFLSKDIKNELENISIQADFAKISSLEKIVKIAEQDSVRIVNTPKFKEYSEKKEGIKKIKIFSWLGIGFLFPLLGFGCLTEFYNRKRRDEELIVLDEKYGIIQSSR